MLQIQKRLSLGTEVINATNAMCIHVRTEYSCLSQTIVVLNITPEQMVIDVKLKLFWITCKMFRRMAHSREFHHSTFSFLSCSTSSSQPSP